jgi:hypothetical protein
MLGTIGGVARVTTGPVSILNQRLYLQPIAGIRFMLHRGDGNQAADTRSRIIAHSDAATCPRRPGMLYVKKAESCLTPFTLPCMA